MDLELDKQIELLSEYLNNGGIEDINSPMILASISRVRFDLKGKVIPESITPPLRAFLRLNTYTHLVEPFYDETFVMNYKSFIQKSLYFHQSQIETKSDFDKIYEELIASKEKILYRGIGEAKYRILSSIQRFWIDNKGNEKGIDFKIFLTDLLDTFRKNNNGQLVHYFNKMGIPHENDMAILSFLQHYGLNSKTPLTDWTYSFDNALYFGASDVQNANGKLEIDKYFSIYYFEEKYLQDASLTKIVKESIDTNYKEAYQNLIQQMKDSNYPDKLGNLLTDGAQKEFIMLYKGRELVSRICNIEKLLEFPILYVSDEETDPRIRYSIGNNMNIINQQGTFIWNSSTNIPLEKIARDEYYKDNPQENVYYFSECINIHKDLKDYVLKMLNDKGVNHNFLFPNNDDIANNIFNVVKNKYGL